MPHSEIHGSKLIRSSPRLIAAYHVLLRLCMPRHPPNALTTLDRSHCQCSSSKPPPKETAKPPTFYKRFVTMPSTCSIRSLKRCHAERHPGRILRPASRDQIRGCAVRQHPPERQSDNGQAVEQSSILNSMNPKGSSGSIFSSRYVQNRQTLNKSAANLYFQGRH